MESRRAVLIGCTYRSTRHPLVGTLIDLYRMYLLLTDLDFTSIDVICDLSEDPPLSWYRDSIRRGEINADILSFVSDLQAKRTYHIMTEPDHLLTILTSSLLNLKRGLVYLTGHGEKNGFVCPNGTLRWTSLRHGIFTSIDRRAEMIMIIDTCHASNLDLPYTIDSNEARLLFVGKDFFPASQVVLLMTHSQEAAATAAGSFITRSLVHLLHRSIEEYCLLQRKIESELRATETLRSMNLRIGIYMSHPTLRRIWPWFWGQNTPIFKCDEGLFVNLHP